MNAETYAHGTFIVLPWGGGLRAFPSASWSSSDFEFTVSLSPSSSQLCPADELFYKGQLLPLHLSPRISMVRTLLLASSSASSSTDTTAAASRDSSGSSSSSDSSNLLLLLPECDDSSRPGSAAEEAGRVVSKRGNYFASLATRFSSVFNRGGSKKDASDAKRSNTSAKEGIKKYVKKVKPLYEKLSSKNQNQGQNQKKTFSFLVRRERDITLGKRGELFTQQQQHQGVFAQSHSFSGNLKYPQRKKCVGSCPSSMRSSRTHSGLLRVPGDAPALASSSMEELQNAIQRAIAHCKSSIAQSNPKKVR